MFTADWNRSRLLILFAPLVASHLFAWMYFGGDAFSSPFLAILAGGVKSSVLLLLPFSLATCYFRSNRAVAVFYFGALLAFLPLLFVYELEVARRAMTCVVACEDGADAWLKEPFWQHALDPTAIAYAFAAAAIVALPPFLSLLGVRYRLFPDV